MTSIDEDTSYEEKRKKGHQKRGCAQGNECPPCQVSCHVHGCYVTQHRDNVVLLILSVCEFHWLHWPARTRLLSMYPVCDGKPERITEGYGYREAKELRVFLSIECFELLFLIIIFILDNNISYADLEDAFDEDGYHRLWRGGAHGG